MQWHAGATPALREPLMRFEKRLRLGEEIDSALACLSGALGDTTASVAFLFAVHRDCGGDLGGMLESLAASLDERARNTAVATASAAGAALSGRMVAGLPLLCVPLLPLSHAPLMDPVGLAILTLGVVLTLADLWWINRLVPVPPHSDHAVAALAEVVASVMSAGIGLRQALDWVTRRDPPEIGTALARARRRVTLGSTWPHALVLADRDDLRGLGRVLEQAHTLGVPIAEAICRFASELRAHRAVVLEEQIRRAPVRMVLPLALCGLPSFLLLTLVPFIRSLSAP
jgi:tight adherence protein B